MHMTHILLLDFFVVTCDRTYSGL